MDTSFASLEVVAGTPAVTRDRTLDDLKIEVYYVVSIDINFIPVFHILSVPAQISSRNRFVVDEKSLHYTLDIVTLGP